MPIVPTQSDAFARVKEIKLSAVVTRCGCAARGLDFRDVHEHLGGDAYGVCPKPLGVEDKGVIASYNADDAAANPIQRIMHKARNLWPRQ
jgi:hypothetical protein